VSEVNAKHLMQAWRECYSSGEPFPNDMLVVDHDPVVQTLAEQFQEVEALQSTNKALRSALEFYADEENWKYNYESDSGETKDGLKILSAVRKENALDEVGRRARQALHDNPVGEGDA